MLLKLLVIYVLSWVLSGCSEPPNMNSNTEAWAIQEPQLVSNARGVQYSLKELEVKRPTTLNASDYLLFNTPTQNINLEIASVCSLGETRTQHHVNSHIKRQLYFSEIMPPRARLAKDWVCSFQFTATNKDGSEHYFELNQYKILDDHENNLNVVEDTTSTKSIDRVNTSLSHKTYFLNQGVGLVRLICDDVQLNTDQKKKVVRLNEFIPNKAMTKDQNLGCRAFELTNEQLVISSSPMFWMVPISLEIELNELHMKRHAYNPPQLPEVKTVTTWSAQNMSNKKIYIALQKKLEPELFQIMTYDQSRRNFNAESFYMPVHWHSTKPAQTHDEYLIYELHQGEHIELYLSTAQRWTCGVWEQGVAVHPGKNDLELLVLHNVEEISDKTIIKKIDVNFYNKKWIGLSKRIHDPVYGHKPKPFGPEDNISTLPVNPSQERRAYCQLYQ